MTTYSIRVIRIDLDDDEDPTEVHIRMTAQRLCDLFSHFISGMPASLAFCRDFVSQLSEATRQARREDGIVAAGVVPEVVTVVLPAKLAAEVAIYTGTLTGITGNEATSELYDCLARGLFNRFYDNGVDDFVPKG